jgi:hypothetical protein
MSSRRDDAARAPRPGVTPTPTPTRTPVVPAPVPSVEPLGPQGGWVSFKGAQPPPLGPRRPWWAVLLRAQSR